MADSSEPAFLFLYRKGAVAPVDYLSTFATAPAFLSAPFSRGRVKMQFTSGRDCDKFKDSGM